MGKTIFRIDFDFWCKLKKCLEKGKNAREKLSFLKLQNLRFFAAEFAEFSLKNLL